ncbi:MAG: hypothetical protein M3124_07065 [Actinomycetota bacterium]|nr:hypothetical protein [Actinomycetota bacterium]
MSATAAMSAGARVAGLVLALGYLTGFVPGPLVAPVGGLALVTFGRCLDLDRSSQVLSAASLAVVAGAVGVTGLRWGTLDLAGLRSVQAVLGPTLLVGPMAGALASIAAAGAAIVALALWLSARPVQGAWQGAWAALETVGMSLCVVTAFWGPKVLAGADVELSETMRDAGVWLGALSVCVVIGVAGALALRALAGRGAMGLMSACALVVIAAAAVAGSVA